ncbi:MAG: peroxidase [bacterium]
MTKLELDDIQGLVARGYGRLRAARFLVLAFGDIQPARQWLASVAGELTPASEDPREAAVQLALTHAGLETLGLAATTLAGFSHEFREGMTTPHRQRVLGDLDGNAPESWRWGGPANPVPHALLMLYTANEVQMAGALDAATERLGTAGIRVLVTLDTTDIGEVEPFGFRDGISQPVPEGFGREGRKEDTVKAGEFVLGYPNEYGELTDRPLVDPLKDPGEVLPQDSGGTKDRDFGRNGTYLVVRQLEQDVRGFWRYLEETTRGSNGDVRPEERDRLGAKMVGRWPGGAPLTTSPDRDDEALAKSNDFGYHHGDAEGLSCPVGAHVRRTNPRDSLDPNPGSADSLALNRRHRILRRGRAYGARLTPEDALEASSPDGIERGLHFACLAANISRQFEFIQHTWANNSKFDGLYDEVDPIMGTRGAAGATFSMPADPVRQRLTGIPQFVTVRGGAYFFLPGLRALRYLSSLK